MKQWFIRFYFPVLQPQQLVGDLIQIYIQEDPEAYLPTSLSQDNVLDF